MKYLLVAAGICVIAAALFVAFHSGKPMAVEPAQEFAADPPTTLPVLVLPGQPEEDAMVAPEDTPDVDEEDFDPETPEPVIQELSLEDLRELMPEIHELTPAEAATADDG